MSFWRPARRRRFSPLALQVLRLQAAVRLGALNLFAAIDTRSGEVTGILRRRKRQVEFIDLLEQIDRSTPADITVIHILCDNVSVHHGKKVPAWLAEHPRFRMHFTPVHCSWMNSKGALELLDRSLAMLWRMTHSPRP